MRKLSHLLYFFANVMGGTKDLTGKCEEYASQLLTKTGKIVEKGDFCNQLNKGGKHALIIDIFSTGGLNCIKERSVIHGVGVMDPAPRSGNTWKGVFEKIGSKCVGRGTKGFPVKFEYDEASEERIMRLHREYQRQLDEIYEMKGNITTTTTANNKSVNMNAEKQSRKINNNRSLGNAVGNKRTRNNNNNANTKKPNVKRRPFAKVIKPPLTTAATGAARAMNAINRKSVGDKRTRNNNNNAKTVKRVKPAARTNVINLTKNNNNNKSLDQLRKTNRAYRQQILNTTERFQRYPANASLRKKLLGLHILKAEGAATYHKKTGDTIKERTARAAVVSLKKRLT